MKYKLSIIVTLTIILLSAKVSFAQTNQTPVISSPIFQFLTQSSNYVVAAYGMFDLTSGKSGAGVGIGYRLSEFVVPTLRLDAVVDPRDNKLALFAPSGNLQLQAPVKILGKVDATPFAFVGGGTELGGRSDGSLIGIIGGGVAVKLNSTKWYVPRYLLADYEHWTGGGFNNNQIRAGAGWSF